MSRDPLELRKHVATVPNDVNDPARFAQMVETAQDAIVLELRHYFETQNFRTDQRQEIPTIEKYAFGFGAGLDPYQTFVKVVADFPDVTERLPHVAVTATSGQNRRLTAGRPLIGHTQLPPRVTSTEPGPYVLADAVAQVSVVTVVALPVAPTAYSITVDGETVTLTFAPGATASNIVRDLALALRTSLIGLVIDAQATPGASPELTLTARAQGLSYVITTSANLSITTTVAAGATQADQLVLRTREGTSVIQFPARRFATSEPLSAVPASAFVRVFNEQALYLTAREVPVGLGTGVQIETGGRLSTRLPNEVEVLEASSPGLVSALGLAVTGTGSPGDTIGGEAPDMTLNVAGASFTAALVGRYVTLSGTSDDGRHLITAVGSPNSLSFTSTSGVPEVFSGSYFIGARDSSSNPARPVMNRYHVAMGLNVTIDILAESPNERRELLDLVLALFLFEMEIKHFTIYGRGIFEPDLYPDEHYQISISQEVNDGGQQEYPRGEDQKNKIYAARVVVPLSILWYIDRQVLVPYGPEQGQSWTLEAENLTQETDTLC